MIASITKNLSLKFICNIEIKKYKKNGNETKVLVLKRNLYILHVLFL